MFQHVCIFVHITPPKWDFMGKIQSMKITCKLQSWLKLFIDIFADHWSFVPPNFLCLWCFLSSAWTPVSLSDHSVQLLKHNWSSLFFVCYAHKLTISSTLSGRVIAQSKVVVLYKLMCHLQKDIIVYLLLNEKCGVVLSKYGIKLMRSQMWLIQLVI